jgi:hypothetical protein
MLTQARLKELLDYDPAVGIFTWRHSRGGWGAGRQAGSVMFDGYRRIGIDGEQYRAHSLAWLYVYGEMPGELDHADRNRDNNAIDNLRRVSQRGQNIANIGRRSTNTSGYKGVSRVKSSGKWLATIKVNGKSRNLGTYLTPQEAHEAYMKAAREAFGEFACAS